MTQAHQDLGIKLIQAEALVKRIEAIVDPRLAILTELSAAYKAGGYAGIRSDYRKIISAAIDDYLTSSDRATGYISTMRKAAVEHFTDAFHGGYTDGGGDVNEIDPDADTWLTDRIEQEMGFIGELFTALKSLRDEFKTGEIKIADLRDAAATRTDGYVRSLDSVYSSGKLWGGQNKMLTMVGDDGKESCRDCQRNKGKRYSAKKWLRIGYPPSRDYECGGYNCQHYLEDDQGNQVTL